MDIIAAMKVGKMATFETLDIIGTYAGFEAAIYGMRAPLKSYAKADSKWEDEKYELGPNDYDLAKRLCKAGSEHGKWLRQVPVWVKATLPRYIWSEWDTYKIGTAANSESTMHKLKDEDLMDFKLYSFPYGFDQDADAAFDDYLFALSSLQLRMNECYKQGDKNGKYWGEGYHRLLKAMLPEGFNQIRIVSLNYQVLQNMYRQRKDHRLPEWNTNFVNWVKTLPYSEFITDEFTEN